MKYSTTILIVFLSTMFSSCQTNWGTGILSGGAIGAGIGGIAQGGTGAIIGSAAGVITGGLIGAVLDEQDRKVMKKTSPRTVDRMDRSEPLTINDVIKLSQGGVSDSTILGYLKESEVSYELTQAQIRRMQNAGVSQRVIKYMVDSGR